MKIEYTLVRNSKGKWDMKFDKRLKIRDDSNDIPIGLKEHDTITHINEKPVHNSDDVMKIIRKLNTSGADSFRMRLTRKQQLSGEFGRRYPVPTQKNHKIYTLKEMSESNLSRKSNSRSKSKTKSQSANIIFENIDGPISARLKENYFGKKSKKKRPKLESKKYKNKSNTKKKQKNKNKSNTKKKIKKTRQY